MESLGEISANKIVVDIRERLEITQTELATRIGSSQDLVSRYEIGVYPMTADFAFRLSSEATAEEATILRSISSPRSSNIIKMVRGTTAILRAFSKWEQTPPEAKQLLEEFLPRWNEWLDNYH